MFLLLQFGTLQTPDQKLEFTSTIIHNVNSESVVVNQNVFQAVMQSLNFLNFLLKPESTVFCHIMSYLQNLSNVTVRVQSQTGLSVSELLKLSTRSN